MRLDSTRLDSARLPSTPLDSTRPGPRTTAAATLSPVAAPRLSMFSGATAPWIRDLIYTDVAQVYVCTDVPTAKDTPRSLSHLARPLLTTPGSFSFFSSGHVGLGSMVGLCRYIRRSLASRRGLLAGCFASSGLPLARTRPRGYARA